MTNQEEKLRVLFVDDEQFVLDSLRRLLMAEGVDWHTDFCSSASQALQMCREAPYDVVVSDLRMPYMDGARFLCEVKKNWPQSMRVVCSGHVESSSMLASVKAAHRYLVKPCKGSDVKEVIEDLARVKFLLKKESVRKLINRMDHIPVLPDVYLRVMEEIRTDDPSLKRIGGLIAQDVGMSASILRLVNSPFFGLSNEVRQPEQAVTLLGLDTIRSSLLFTHLFQKLDTSCCLGFDVSALWTHCLKTAQLARCIADHEGMGQEMEEQCFAAAMLHDMGKLILLSNFPKDYSAILKKSREDNIAIHDCELEHFGVAHCEVGAYLLGLWGMPDYQIRALACHHHPCQEQECTKDALILCIVHVANALDHELRVINPGYAPHPVDTEYLAQMGYTDRYDEWKKICSERLMEVSGG